MEPSELSHQSAVAVLPEPAESREARTAPPKRKLAPNFHVVIWNDEEHSFEYVIEMLMRLFNHDAAKAYDLTWQVHNVGKAVAFTCHRELAELRREQIASYGPDFGISGAQRVSMRATLQEAPQ